MNGKVETECINSSGAQHVISELANLRCLAEDIAGYCHERLQFITPDVPKPIEEKRNELVAKQTNEFAPMFIGLNADIKQTRNFLISIRTALEEIDL